MAGINLISAAAAALLVLALISGSLSRSEARLLPMDHPLAGNQISETAAAVAPLQSSPPAFHRTPAVSARDVELQGGDFRPTTPGHSPGAGHSLAPASHVDSKIH